MESRQKTVKRPMAAEKGVALSKAFLNHYAQARSIRRGLYHLGLVCLICAAWVLLKPVEANRDANTCVLKGQSHGHRVTVTAYTNIASCTDSTPNETASLLRIRPKHYGKIIALSRDLARGYKYGDRFHLWVNGEVFLVEFQDLMAKKHTNRIDVLLSSKKKCLNFGISRGILLPAEKPTRPAHSVNSEPS
jgi:3D (Asp-Asp-Asp) domain-containing protein